MWRYLICFAIFDLGTSSALPAPRFYAPLIADARQYFHIVCQYDKASDTNQDLAGKTQVSQETVPSDGGDGAAGKVHEAIQSMKIYVGASEVFRYTPSIKPSTRQFSGSHGVNVEWSRCDVEGCELRVRAPPGVAALRCELSAEGPTFEIVSSNASVTVVAEPVYGPTIVGAPRSVTAGDVLLLNCSTDLAAPPANVKWLMDDQMVEEGSMSPLGMGSADELGLRKSWRGTRMTVPPGDEDLRVVCEAAQPSAQTRRAVLSIPRRPLEPQLSKYTAAGGSQSIKSALTFSTVWLLTTLHHVNTG